MEGAPTALRTRLTEKVFSRRCSIPRRSVEAFALLDLLITMLIFGILVMVAIPAVTSTIAQSRLNGAANEMVSGLQYAEGLAVKYGRPFGLIVDGPNSTFSVYDSAPTGDPPVNASNVVVNPIDRAWYVKAFNSIDAYSGTKITSPVTAVSILFYPDGHSTPQEIPSPLAIKAFRES